MSGLTYKWRKGAHRWTVTLLDDGSGVAISEWRSEFCYREWTPSHAKPTSWTMDGAYPEYAGVGRNTAYEITRTLAKDMLGVWRAARINQYKTGWVEL